MGFRDVIVFCLFAIVMDRIEAFGLDDPFRSGCVVKVSAESSSEEFPLTNSVDKLISGNLSASIIRGRDCVIIFKDFPKGKVRLNFKPSKSEFSPKKNNWKNTEKESTEEKQQSCGTSFVKVYDVDSSSESLGSHNTLHSTEYEEKEDKRKRKIGHFCNSMLKDREVSFDFDGRLEVVLVQCKFDVFYDFNSTHESNYKANAYVPPRWIDDSNKTSNKEQSTFRPLFLEKSECERQLKFPCKYSVVCGVAGSKFLCNKTKHLCIDLDDVCNDVNDCMEGDNSDESRCSFPLIKNVSFVLMTVGICSASTVCCLNHKASLRKNNVVRYKGDVIKRKDIIKAKKQGGFAAADTSHLSERKASLTLNNQSITPVDNNTEEKHCSIVKESSQEHGHEVSSTATTTAVVPKKIPEPLTKLSINNLPKSQVLSEDTIKITDNGVGSSAKILYDYSISDDEDMMEDGKYGGAGGGYGYRFEFQNCR